MTVLSNNILILSVLINILRCCSTQSILAPLFSENDLEKIVKNVLSSAPDLKDVILQFEQSDFLNQYKAGENNEDKDLNIFELTEKYGYKLESYPVQTEDGYKITVYRIPGKGDPVLVAHGLLNSAIDWFTIGRENALSCLLADEGYDVWIFNARGCTNASRGHVSLSAEKDPAQYWDFSFDEIGRYDLPATIDHVLKKNGKSTLRYIGFSQGTTSFFVMGSERPEYNNKISLMVALSPVAWMSHILSPLVKVLARLENILEIIRPLIGFNALEENNPLVNILTKHLCGNTEVATLLCGNLLFLLTGFNYNQLNVTQMPVIFGHAPSAVATKQILHYAQGIQSGKFRMYKYDSIENLVKYGSVEPPSYPVDKITTPVALFYKKDTDWLSAYEDVLTLKEKLPNVVHFYEIPNENFCHTDYIWGKDAKKLVYERILELFKKY